MQVLEENINEFLYKVQVEKIFPNYASMTQRGQLSNIKGQCLFWSDNHHSYGF